MLAAGLPPGTRLRSSLSRSLRRTPGPHFIESERLAGNGAAGRARREGAPAVLINRPKGGGTMQIGSAQRGNSEAFLVHMFGLGLDEERYVVERFRSTATARSAPCRSELRPCRGASAGHCGRGTRSPA